jgi:FtsZ-binding cell division protein ZapB
MIEIEEKELEKLKASIATSVEKIAALTSSVTSLTENNSTLLEEKLVAKTAAQAATDDAAKKSGDIETLEASWGNKLTAAVGEKQSEIDTRNSIIAKMTSGAAATAIANEIALDGCVDAVLPHIKLRLTTEIVNGVAELKILDASGKISALTLDELKTEISNLKFLAPVIKGSNANGNGNPGSGEGGTNTKKFSELSGAELKVIRDNDVEEYNRLKKEYDAGI